MCLPWEVCGAVSPAKPFWISYLEESRGVVAPLGLFLFRFHTTIVAGIPTPKTKSAPINVLVPCGRARLRLDIGATLPVPLLLYCLSTPPTPLRKNNRCRDVPQCSSLSSWKFTRVVSACCGSRFKKIGCPSLLSVFSPLTHTDGRCDTFAPLRHFAVPRPCSAAGLHMLSPQAVDGILQQ